MYATIGQMMSCVPDGADTYRGISRNRQDSFENFMNNVKNGNWYEIEKMFKQGKISKIGEIKWDDVPIHIRQKLAQKARRPIMLRKRLVKRLYMIQLKDKRITRVFRFLNTQIKSRKITKEQANSLIAGWLKESTYYKEIPKIFKDPFLSSSDIFLALKGILADGVKGALEVGDLIPYSSKSSKTNF